MEIGLCLFWANNKQNWSESLSARLQTNLLAALGMVHFRAIHFWVIHRLMHPWT